MTPSGANPKRKPSSVFGTEQRERLTRTLSTKMKIYAIERKSSYALCGVAVGLAYFLLCPKSVSADIYKNEAECVTTNTTAASDPQSVKALCSGIIYPIPRTQTQIDFEKEKEQLEKTTLPLEKFFEVQKEREVKWQERKREEEEEERKQKEKERVSRQKEQKRSYCKELLDEASGHIAQEEKRGVPRYWSEHHMRANPQYAECQWYK